MTDTTSMASLSDSDGEWTLRFERTLPHPAEKVWRALTKSEQLRHWMPVDIVRERRTGADIELRFRPDIIERFQVEEPISRGRITVWEPPSTFEWTWGDDRVRWELAAEGSATALSLTVWLGTEDVNQVADNATGYHGWMVTLAAMLAGTPQPLEHDDSLQERYQETVDRLVADRLD